MAATGFDSVTGAITQIDLRGMGGKTIREAWKDGVYTNLGMTVSGFPNMFFTYGPHAPTALSNGPSCVVSTELLLLCDIKADSIV